jgi:hypothetical protein
MARKVFTHRFMVSGSRQFPADMLRYDRCYPESNDDVAEMFTTSAENNYDTRRRVELVAREEKHWTPTKDRWRSFGWLVLKHTPGRCIND